MNQHTVPTPVVVEKETSLDKRNKAKVGFRENHEVVKSVVRAILEDRDNKLFDNRLGKKVLPMLLKPDIVKTNTT